MDRPRLIWRLRITWTAACALLCLLLSLLWVRSYWVYEGIVHGSKAPSEPTHLVFTSDYGTVGFVRANIPPTHSLAGSVDGWDYQNWGAAEKPERRFLWGNTNKDFVVRLPTWLPIMFVCGLAAMPWIVNRFSRRTLLSAVTILAIGFAYRIVFVID
jgi:hypothetical protein